MRITWARWGRPLLAAVLIGVLLVGFGAPGTAIAGSHSSDVHLEADNATVYTNQSHLRVNGTIHNDGDAAASNIEIKLTDLPDDWYSSTESISRLNGGEKANFTLYLDLSEADENSERDEQIHVAATDRSGEVANSSLTVSLVHPPFPGEEAPESDGVDEGEVDDESRYEQCLDKAENQFWPFEWSCDLKYDSPLTGVFDKLPGLPDWLPFVGE